MVLAPGKGGRIWTWLRSRLVDSVGSAGRAGAGQSPSLRAGGGGDLKSRRHHHGAPGRSGLPGGLRHAVRTSPNHAHADAAQDRLPHADSASNPDRTCVPLQVRVTVMTTQQKQVTENVTQQYAVCVPVQVPVAVMTTQTRQVPRQVAITRRVMVPVPAPAATAPAAGSPAVASPQS
jgi:hypothetical protein